MRRSFFGFLIGCSFLSGCAGSRLPASEIARETGSISGRVTNSVGRPLSFASLLLLGTHLGSLADSSGHYTMLKVPVGTYRISARRLGYDRPERTVPVRAGEEAIANFTLHERLVRTYVDPIVNGSVVVAGFDDLTVTVDRGEVFIGGNQISGPYTLSVIDSELAVNGYHLSRTVVPPDPQPLPTRRESLASEIQTLQHVLSSDGVVFLAGSLSYYVPGSSAALLRETIERSRRHLPLTQEQAGLIAPVLEQLLHPWPLRKSP